MLALICYVAAIPPTKAQTRAAEQAKKEEIKRDKIQLTDRKINDQMLLNLAAKTKNVDAGMAIFSANCKVCHNVNAKGMLGPNLTDTYSKHGSNPRSIFNTIYYGVPEKGMRPWKSDLSLYQIADVTAYIISLKGSNPKDG